MLKSRSLDPNVSFPVNCSENGYRFDSKGISFPVYPEPELIASVFFRISHYLSDKFFGLVSSIVSETGFPRHK